MYHTITGDDMTKLYHGTRNKEKVMHHGLEPRDGLSNEGMLGEGIEEAIFLTPNPMEAAEYGTVIQVDATSLTLDIIDGPQSYHYFSLKPISQNKLTVVKNLNTAYKEYEIMLQL